MTPQQANELLEPTRYEFSYRNDFNDKYSADREEDPDGEYVLLADVQDAIDFWNRRAPAPTEPAVDRDAVLREADQTCRLVAWEYANEGDGEREAGAEACRNAIQGLLATPASPAVPAGEDFDSLIYPPKAMLKREDWDATTRKPRVAVQTVPDPSASDMLKLLREAESAAQTVPAEQSDIVFGWDLGLSDAAFYVEGHCANGAHHAETILAMEPPKIPRREQVAQASQPTSAEGGQ